MHREHAARRPPAAPRRSFRPPFSLCLSPVEWVSIDVRRSPDFATHGRTRPSHITHHNSKRIGILCARQLVPEGRAVAVRCPQRQQHACPFASAQPCRPIGAIHGAVSGEAECVHQGLVEADADGAHGHGAGRGVCVREYVCTFMNMEQGVRGLKSLGRNTLFLFLALSRLAFQSLSCF